MRYLDAHHEGRRITGETPLDQGLDAMWDNRVWVQISIASPPFTRLAPGSRAEARADEQPQWGEHCRKEALSHAALVDRHLSEGREWLLGGEHPTFADVTLCTAIASRSSVRRHAARRTVRAARPILAALEGARELP